MSAREVSLMGGSPWGFRMHGGCDQHQPLRISRVNPGSKAAQQGVREGDLISSINGKSTRDLTNGEAHALLRNAGDQLKLGLNQENGSPKRRIYKSSLQENTSIETIKKTTTKTTTSTQIISTETKKNGTDDAKNEPSYENQNGNLKINSTSQQEESDKKYESNGHIHSSQADFLDYATDNESISCLGIKMPCGSRSRRNKRNRQRKRFQHSSSPPKDVLNNHELTKVTEEETPGNFTESIEEELKEKEELEKLVNGPTEEVKQNGLESLKKEAKIDGATLKITTEKLSPEKLPFIENMSTARSRIMRRNKIEKKVLNADTQICEITTIRNAVPLEARLDHIAGVGIVESSLNAVETPTENLSSTVTISEPTEPVEPLSEDLATKVENLPGIKTCMTVAIPMKRFDFLEIHEMTDSEIEGDTNSSYQKPQQQGIIIEAESDFERESSIEDSRKEDPKKEKTEDENDDNMPWEIEKQLRSFIEGLRLPSSPTETVTTSVNNKLHEIEVNGWDIPRGSSKTSSTRKRGAVAGSLGSYQSHLSQESNRCLDIIQEEGESKNLEEETSSSDEKIRDFINEEIGKFRRERRDLKSVLREDRLSVEMEEEEENAVEAQEKIDKVKDTDSEVIKTEVKEQKQEKEISSIENKNENKRKDEIDESQCKKVCDININDEKKEKTKTVLVKESDTESTFAQHENVETFMNLVKSLKERVINEVRLEKMEKSQEANKSHCQSMEENNVKEEYVTNKIESSSHNFEIQKNQEIPEIKCVTNTVESSEKSKDFMTQEKNVMNKDELNQQSKNITVEKTKIECDKNNTQLKQESENLVNKNNVKNENISEIVENLDKIKNVNKEINSNKVVNITNENAVLVKVEGNSKITEPEVNLVPENSLKKDVVKVKNNESSSGASLKEVVIHNVKQIDINNEITKITNDTILNDEEDNKNNDDNIASKTQLSNVDANCINNDETPNVIKTNTSKSNVEISGIKNRFFDISITEEITKEEEKENNVEVTVTEIENVESTKPNDSNKETKIEESLTKIPSKSEIAKENKTENKESKEKIFTKDEILNSFSKEKKIDVSKTQLKQQNEEPESPTPIETITTSGYAENETESPEEIPKIEEHSIPIIFENIFFSDNPPEIPPPPLRSSFRPPDVPDLPFDFPFCEGLIFIERVPPPPPVRNHNIVFVTDSRYPSEFPFYPQQASKFAMFHQRAMNAFDIDEQLETIDFIKSLLTILSHQETTRQDVQNLLSLYDIEKLPPNIRGIIDDLMAPTPSMSSAASTTSDVGGFTDLCNELYELADYKTGIDASLEIASANSNEAPPVPPHRKKFAYTRVEGEEIPPRPLSPSKPVQKPENHSSEKLLTAEHIPRPQIVRNVVSPDFQGHHQHQDSSNSTTSPNTTKYNPVKSSVADITVKDIPKPPGSDPNDNKSLPKSQSLLLNSKEEEKEKSNSKAESSQPISFSSADDHLYYVPLLDEPSTATATNLGANKNDDKIHKSDEFSLPGSLKDLCMKKIMSMPRGEKLIDEIPAPKLNTFNNSNNIQNCSTGKNSNTNKDGMPSKIEKISDKTIKKETYESHREEKTETFSSTKKITEIKEITNQKRKNWTGVPTKQNPKVLVCFSPAQQETEVKTTADNLLDLHKKFINRRGYYHDHSQSISPPKYFVDISPKMEAPEPPIKGSSRLLNIIKENPIPANKKQQKQDQQPNGLISQSRQNGIEKVSTHDENQERLRATRLNDWLSLARRDNSTTASGNILIEHTDKQQQQNCYHENVFNKRSGSPLPPRNVTPTALRKSPISFNSAIIDKSQEYRRPPTITGRAPYTIIDPWYINPALIIEDKPEVPPRVKRTVTVDRDCIDTRSIFDQTPVTPKSKNLENPEVLKQMPAVEIMENLKQLQTGMKERIDKRNRYSLPQEYFDKQLKYIETLENQLKEVIIAEEKEKKAAEEFKKEIEKKKNKPRPYSMSESSFLDRPSHKTTYQQSNNTLNKDNQINKNNDNTTHKDQWKESSKKVDGDNVEFESKEGSREIKNEVKNENGFYSKTSSEKIEKKEEHHVTTTNINKKLPEESKLKTFLRDLHDPKIDKMHCSSETNKSATSNDTEKRERPKLERPVSIAAIPTNGEVFRQQMYDEYVHKVHEREERKHHKVIKISSHSDLPVKKSIKRCKDLSNLNKVEREFIEKAQSRLNKYGIKLDESETEGGASSGTDLDAKFLVDGKEIKDVKNLPKHLQEFLRLSAKREEEKEEEEQKKNGVWSPGSESTKPQKPPSPERGKDGGKDEAIPAVWTPSSAGPSPVPERKEFRPVPFESPVLSRKKITQQLDKSDTGVPPPPWKEDEQKKEASQVLSHNIPSSRIVNSYSAPNALAGAPRLPRAQNPTITLLQKAREGQLPKGAAYLDEADQSSHRIDGERPLLSPGEVIYTLKKEYESEPESENAPPKKMADLGPRKYEGIGPTTRTGVPIVLRSEVKEDNKAKWYKRMYDSLHRAPKDDDYITIRYKPHRGTRTGYSGASSGYLSEPEPRSYTERSATLDNRRHRQRNKENDFSTSTLPRHAGRVDGHYSPDTYHMNPGRIEDYIPGNCSIQEKEAKEPPSDLTWAKRKPFEQPSTHSPKSYMTHALKESGYESDSTLVFRRREDASPLSPLEQRIAYKTVQKGGDVPLHGLRKPAPERPKESPRRYVEGEVTIHYRSPVRAEAKEPLSEEELARRSAENMRRVYQEERRRKYLQELHDIDSRRHTDNFIPSQKSPIPLNRYDDFIDDLSYRSRSQEQTPEPRLVARALYNFVGQSPRELTFRRGDLIFVRRQVDKNWYEGEHNAMIGLFPFNYVEIIPYDEIRTLPKKPYEGQARAKFNFIAQTNLELSLSKGELVYLTRRVDENWWEGRIGNRKGIFPVSYVEVISEPGHRPETPVQGKPVASPAAHSLLTNGSAGGKLSMGPHHYTPSLPVNINTTQPHYNSLPKGGSKVNVAPLNEALHIDTHSEPIPYRALYNYRPQNDDELELNEGDTVYVMEKCDDGWYVGSSQRTGYFGTFPGNYVERL